MSSFGDFLLENWLWWAVPIVVVLAVVVFVILWMDPGSSAGDATFVYDAF